MTTRKRLTWSGKTASPPPADPGYEEPSVHPAAYPDPGPDDYKNGDTSSWAEDPHPGPYPNTPHPALPGTEAPQGHPITDPAHYFPGGVGKQAAAQLRAAMEVKAAKCIRIATAMLGKTATVDAIEDQALDLMNLTERQIQAALQRLGNYTLDTKKSEKDEMPEDAKAPKEDKKASDDDESDEDDANEDAEKLEKDEEKADEDKDEETAGKKASRLMRQAFYWVGVAKKAGEMPEALKEFQFGKKKDDEKGDDKKEDKAEDKKDDKADKKAGRKATSMPGTQNDIEHYEYRARGVLADELEALNEDEELLAEMLKEESKKAADAEKAEEKTEEKPAEKEEDKADKAAALDPEEEALLAGMLSEEDAPAVTACGESDGMDSMGDIVLDSDPMGLMDESGADLMTEDELSALYGSKFAGDDKDEEKTEEKVEGKKEAKTASKAPAKPVQQHPQPRRASTGVRALGGTPRVASAGRDSDDLSKLWETAPDVSKIFG